MKVYFQLLYMYMHVLANVARTHNTIFCIFHNRQALFMCVWMRSKRIQFFNNANEIKWFSAHILNGTTTLAHSIHVHIHQNTRTIDKTRFINTKYFQCFIFRQHHYY